MAIKRIREFLSAPVSPAPLAVFRMLFGALMLISVIRFAAMGWIDSMYIQPKVFFPYFGFEWIKPLAGAAMYVVFGIMALACVGIAIGLFYRISSILFFLLFTYAEMIDKTNYLNHYYFISLIAFLIIFLPAGKVYSVDNHLRRRLNPVAISRWTIFVLQAQIGLVYFFAGVAKVGEDWLVDAAPLRYWLPAYSHLPVIGPFMESGAVALVFSWAGCLFDLCIPFVLFYRRAVYAGFALVVIFHAVTGLLFHIGMFPLIMITGTTAFLPATFHEKVIGRIFGSAVTTRETSFISMKSHAIALLAGWFFIQLIVPMRYLFYSGPVSWTEQGFRFSWRVMRIEKAGAAFFTVKDPFTGRECDIDNRDYLTPIQEKMMATQPDMMVDYAKFLKMEFGKRGIRDPEVRVKSFVTLNGSGSREFVDPSFNLAQASNNWFTNKSWIRVY
jgi:hypothetical protein